jgi:hypothetical protein
MSDETTDGPTCSKCGENQPGPGGILCSRCLHIIAAEKLPGAVVDEDERRRLLAEARP